VALAIVRHFYPERFRALQRQRTVFCLIVACALFALYLDTDTIHLAHQMRHPFLITMVDYASAALLLLLYHPGKEHSLPYRLVARIGVFSYGIYLWHVSVERPVNFLAGHLHGMMAAVTLSLLPYLLAIGLGIAATKAVELPFLRLRERWVPSATPEPPVPVGEAFHRPVHATVEVEPLRSATPQ
jgi:peptidoglycan/LPS O-acetylase OafA/YrhL